MSPAGYIRPDSSTQAAPPRWNSPCRGEGACPPRSSNQKASTRRVQLSVATKAVRLTDLKTCQDLRQHWLDKTRNALSSYSTPLGVVTVRLYVGSPLSDCPPLCCDRRTPEVSEEEGSYDSRVYRWFLESSKSCLLLLVALAGLTVTLAQLLA